ncbi:CASP-like protein 1F2 [Senna tora]|uniref:CASP-like protein n=1 Tax=Senna tora TaxID=362788 RepID=A0A834SJ20_9FABA|nr:CASP-like protein 1F2 [Senna tora]
MAASKDSFMLDAKSPPPSSSTPQPQYNYKILFTMLNHMLRILAILLCAASIAIMVTNTQTVTLFTIEFEAHYYYSSTLKFFVAANAVVCGFSLLSLIVGFFLLRRRRSSSQPTCLCFFFFLFLHDLVMTVLMISGCAAATAIGYVGQYGESHVGWLAICDRVPKFCRTNLVSLFLSFLAFFAYLALTILMAYKLMSSPPKNF